MTSTTYSTRFDPKQRELIESPAQRLNWSSARFIRDATVCRAADVVNASGFAELKLRELATTVLDQLLNPSFSVTQLVGDLKSAHSTRTITRFEAERYRENARQVPADEGQWCRQVKDIEPLRPHDSDLAQVRSALETAGRRFVELRVQVWNSRDAGIVEYSPTVLANQLMGDKAE